MDVFHSNVIDFSNLPFFLYRHVFLNKQTKTGLKHLEAVFALYCVCSLLLCLGKAFFFPILKRQIQRDSNLFYSEVKIYLYDLNKISSTEVRGYRPPRSC